MEECTLGRSGLGWRMGKILTTCGAREQEIHFIVGDNTDLVIEGFAVDLTDSRLCILTRYIYMLIHR